MKRAMWPILIALAAILTFEPALGNQWTSDDELLAHLLPTPRGVGELLATATQSWWPADHNNNLWRPVTRLSIAAQKFVLGGGEPRWTFYGVNLLLHAAVALALWLLALRLGFGGFSAGAAGLLFAVHPIHNEAVQQIVGRAELLGALFMLLGLWALATPRLAEPRVWNRQLLWQPLWLALALGSKEHAVVYPALVALLLWDRRDAAGRRMLLTPRGGALLGVAMLVVVLFLAGKAAVTGGLIEPVSTVPRHENVLAMESFAQRLPSVLGIFGFATTRLAWPTHLSPDYSLHSFPFELGWGWRWSWLGLALLVATLALVLRNAVRGGRGWLIALGGLGSYALTSNFFFVIGVVMAERLWYWPSAAACLGAGWAIGLARARLPEARRRLAGLGLALVALLLMAGSWHNAAQWRSPRGRAEWTLRLFPENWRAHVDLAREDFLARNFEKGLAEAREGTRILPQNPFGWDWVGMNATFATGHDAEADAAFARATTLKPALSLAHYHWGLFMEMHGRNAEAAAQYRIALTDPSIEDRPLIEAHLKRAEKR